MHLRNPWLITLRSSLHHPIELLIQLNEESRHKTVQGNFEIGLTRVHTCVLTNQAGLSDRYITKAVVVLGLA